MYSTISIKPVARKNESKQLHTTTEGSSNHSRIHEEHHRLVVARRRFVTQQEELKTFPDLAKPGKTYKKKNQDLVNTFFLKKKPYFLGSIASFLYNIYNISWIALPTSTYR